MARAGILACLGFLVFSVGCGNDDDDEGGDCDLGEAKSCACIGLPSGVDVCSPEGNVWYGCECPPAASNPPPVTVGDLMWKIAIGPAIEQEAAAAYCTDETDGGYQDWRLPTKQEFETFFTGCSELGNGFFQCTGQCNDSSFCDSAAPTFYRTSSEAGPGKHYIVHIGNAYFVALDDNIGVSTLCVRDVSSQ